MGLEMKPKKYTFITKDTPDFDSMEGPLRRAFSYAQSASHDPRDKVGAVVQTATGKSFYGVNRFPDGIADDDRWHDRELKNQIVLHAEVSAILNCIRAGLRPHALYVTKPPCVRCAGIILASGVRHVTFPQRDNTSTWAGSQKQAIELFLEANIYVNEVQYTI